MVKEKLIVLGSLGQLGSKIIEILKDDFLITSLNRIHIDFKDFKKLELYLNNLNPKVIINCAAYTAVDNAEQFYDEAYVTNALIPEFLARWTNHNNSYLIHFSTDYVFDGAKKKPYLENDKVNPLSVYGSSKSQGDMFIQKISERYLIFRSGWIYSSSHSSFLTKVWNKLKNKETLNIVNDQYGSPISTNLIAKTIRQVLIIVKKSNFDTCFNGIYNISCSGQCSWFDIAKQIKFHYDKDPIAKDIFPIETSLLNQSAKRPFFSKLSNKKIKKIFNIDLPKWQNDLKKEIILLR